MNVTNNLQTTGYLSSNDTKKKNLEYRDRNLSMRKRVNVVLKYSPMWFY